MIYRTEIDGLRALAVIPVIFFHAGFIGFSNGYLGVDVFFIISGYLITSFLIKNKHTSKNNLHEFYIRRIRRIIPILYLVTFVSLPIGLLLMQPYDLENFGQSLVASTLMSSNILFFITNSYWEPISEFKPLLHTWSLSIEEQFYLFFPLLFIFFTKDRLKKIMYFIFLIWFVSFFLWVIFTIQGNSKAVFYLLPFRAWELMTGGVLACLLFFYPERLNNRFSEVFSIIGLCLLILGFVITESNKTIHVMNVISAILGTSLIILFASNTDKFKKILCFPPLVLIGLMSFSLYMWHVPIFAFLRIASYGELPNDVFAITLLFLLPLSYFSWKIELYFRDRNKISNSKLIMLTSIFSLILLSTGLSMHFKQGFPERFDGILTRPNTEYISTKDYLLSASKKLDNFTYSDSKMPQITIMGDSFSSDLINMLLEVGIERSYKISKQDYNCINAEQDSLEGIAAVASASEMTFVSYNMLYNNDQWNCFNKLINMFKSQNINFLVIGSKNFGINMNPFVVRPKKDFYVYPNNSTIAFNKALSNMLDKNFIDLLPMISNQDNRIPIYTDNGRIISEDAYHLTPAGAEYIGIKLKAYLRENNYLSNI